MSSDRAVPTLLAPYLVLPPESSLILLTSVLDASTNWLVLRFIARVLSSSSSSSSSGGGSDANQQPVSTSTAGGIADQRGSGHGAAAVKVVLLSFLRDYAFWRDGSRKLGVDLDKLALRKHFVFIDGLTELYLPHLAASRPVANAARQKLTPHLTLQSPSLQAVEAIILEAIASLRNDLPPQPSSSSSPPPPPPFPPQLSPSATAAATAAGPNAPPPPPSASSTHPSPPPRIVLVVDAPDFLLASASNSSPPSTTAGTAHPPTSPPAAPTTSTLLAEMLLSVRAHAHSAVLALSADAPLLSSSSSSFSSFSATGAGAGGFPGTTTATRLEREHAAFAVATAHQADLVMALRPLGSGVARDVSGVLRITTGGGGGGAAGGGEDSCVGGGDDDDEEKGGGGGTRGVREAWEEREVLYHVGTDGAARVFERGQ